MKDQVTSIEQSKRLIELGVPAERASMVWHRMFRGKKTGYTEWGLKIGPIQKFPRLEVLQITPAYTVADLLMMLPPKISWQDPSDGNFRMRRYMGENGIEWVVDYDCFIANDVCIINALVKAITLLVSTKHELNL